MEIVLDKIFATSDRAIAELQKTTMNSWTMANVHTIKHVLDRLRLCFDEFHFHLQKKNLKDEANLLQRLSQHFFTIFDKIEEVNQKKVTNPIDMPIEYCFKPPNIISQKTLFGGAEVQSFSIYSKQQAKLLSAEPEYRATKQRTMRNVQTKGTDTNEDAFVLLSGTYLQEKEKEIIKLEQENAQNLMELEKHLKMKGMWSELHASNAQHKVQELYRQMEKESYRNELFVNEQLKFQNQEEDDEQQKDIKKDLNEKIISIQRKTADQIIKAADKKMKHEYEKFVLKKTAGILMRKNKHQNYQRLDELEALILTKNEEIFDKEQKMNSILQKFEAQEKKLGDLAKEIDVYKEHEQIGSFNSHRKNENSNDIEIQVNITDRRIFSMELQLQEIIQENDQFKAELKLIHQQALNEKKKTISSPKQIEEIILMILQSDLTPNNKIEAMQTLLQYISDNSEEEFIKMAPNEIFKIVKSKVVVSQRNFEEKVEDPSEEEYNSSQPSLVKKKKKPKIKQNKKGQEKSSDKDYSIESSENLQSTKQLKKKNNEDSSQDKDADISEYNSNSNTNLNNKKQIKNLYKISEESQHFKNSPRIQLEQAKTPKSKSSNRSVRKGNTKDGYLKVDQNNSQQQQQQQQTQYNGKSQQLISNNNQTKEASHFKTESQRQVSSGSRLNPMSRQTNSRQESLQQNSIKDLSQFQKQGESQSNIKFSSQNSQIQQNQILSKQHSNYNSEHEEIDSEQISSKLFSKGIQVSMNQNLMNQSQQCIETQKNLSRLGSQIIPSADQTVSHTPIAKNKTQEVEKVTAKYSQTDDFFLFNLVQKMAADIGLSEDQLKRLSQIFLNEQQFVHYYEKDGPTYFMQQLQQQSLQYQQQQQQQQQQNSINNIPSNQNNKSISRASSLIMDKEGRFIELQRSESVKLGQNNNQKNDTSPDSEINKQQRVSILRSQQKSQQSPTLKNQILLSYTNESSIQINQHRSVSQNSDVHIMNYGPVSPENKQKRASQSQRILEEMLKNKSTIASPKEAEVREQKLYFSIFGDEMQNDADFEMEAVRNNLGRPLEVVQDHMKEEAIKKIFTQFATRPKNQWQESIYMVISQFANKPIQAITYIDFKKYYENYMRVHKRCGDGCIHIQRFLARVGFGINSKRKQLNMSKANLSPFGQLPKLK